MYNFENAEAESVALQAKIETFCNPIVSDLPDLNPPLTF
jgi:hypothetical protein